jgi:uncharacterized protein involved in outer membrane biogenesis
MNTAKKIIWSVVIVLVILVIIGAIIASAFLGDITKKAIETLGPRITKVSVTVDQVHLSLLTGSASVKGLVVGNPQGYQAPQAISAGLIAVDLNPLSVLSDKIVVHSLRMESPDITFEGGLRGNNLSQILDNVNGSAQQSAQNGGAVPAGPNAPAKPSKKYEVDDLVITGAKVHVLLTDLGGKEQTLSLPPIHLTGLGKSQEGITVADLSRSVLDAIVAQTVKTVAANATNLKNAEHLIINTGKNAATVSNITRGLNNLLGK